MQKKKPEYIDALEKRVKKAIENQKDLKVAIDSLIELSNSNIKNVYILSQMMRGKNYQIKIARWQAVAITLVIGYVCLVFYAIVN